MRRFLWLLLMVLVLIGSAAGAYTLTHSQADYTPVQDLSRDSIYAQGHIEPKDGVVEMYPQKPGRVVKVAAENDVVKAGEILIQVDDTLAQLDLRMTQEEQSIAQTLLSKAQLDVELYPFKVEQLSATIAALQHKYAMVEAEARIAKKSLSKDFTVTEDREITLKEGPAQVKSLVEVKQAELKELQKAREGLAIQVRQAQANLKLKETIVEKAKEALRLYQVRAPSQGSVLRVLTREGETLGTNPRSAALQFCAAGPLIVRAEVLQEWGQLVKEGQQVVIEDETSQARQWQGEVQTISQWYGPTRSPIIEPFKMNDVRTLECIIRVTGPEEGLRIGQRVRVKINASAGGKS